MKEYSKLEMLNFAKKCMEHLLLSIRGYSGDISTLEKIKIRQTIATFNNLTEETIYPIVCGADDKILPCSYYSNGNCTHPAKCNFQQNIQRSAVYKPTMMLKYKWKEVITPLDEHFSTITKEMILQQMWVGDLGEEDWRDIEIAE